MSEVGNQSRSCGGEVVVALDLAGDRLAIDRLEHHECHAVVASTGIDQLGDGNATPASCCDHAGLDEHVALVTGALALQDEVASIGVESPGLAGCTS